MGEEENFTRPIMSTNRRRQMRDPPSIPFLWEAKPGIPKINWTLPHSILKNNPQNPIISFSNPSLQGISGDDDHDDDDDGNELNDMFGFNTNTVCCTTDESLPQNLLTQKIFLSSKAIFEANILGRPSSYPTEVGTFTTIRPDLLIRKPHTLGELIMMMSRRLSCRRKAIQMRKSNLSVEIRKNKFFGCFIPGRLHQRRILG